MDLVELDAKKAAALAAEAVDVWGLGDFAKASSRLEEAIAIEARYRNPIAYPGLRPLMQEKPMAAS